MEAIGAVIRAGCGLDQTRVVESYQKRRPRYEAADQFVVFRLAEVIPFQHPGAGRLGALREHVLEVIVYTRMTSDTAGRDERWARDQGRGHYRLWNRVDNVLQGKKIFQGYDLATGEPHGDPLTITVLQAAKHDAPDKDKDDPGWGETHLYYSFQLVAPLAV